MLEVSSNDIIIIVIVIRFKIIIKYLEYLYRWWSSRAPGGSGREQRDALPRLPLRLDGGRAVHGQDGDEEGQGGQHHHHHHHVTIITNSSFISHLLFMVFNDDPHTISVNCHDWYFSKQWRCRDYDLFVFGEEEGLSSLNLMTTIAKRGRGHRREQSMSSTWRWLTTMRLARKRLIMRRWRVTSNQLLPLAYILLNSLSCHWINLSCSAVHEVVHEVGQVNH